MFCTAFLGKEDLLRRGRLELTWPSRRGRVGRRSTVAWRLGFTLLAAFGLGLIGIGLVCGMLFSRWGDDRARYSRQSKVSALQAQAERLEAELVSLRTEEARLRVSAGLDPLHEDVLTVGVGGSQYEPPQTDADYAQARLDRLGRSLGLLKSSFAQVEVSLVERAEGWRRVPCVHPIPGSLVVSQFGMRTHPVLGVWAMHEGTDFGARRGTPVVATADGVVKSSGWKPGFGYTVTIDHGGGYSTKYAHNSKNKVKKGERVRRGDVVALLGSTGVSTGPHLHYEVRVNGVPKDPLQFILPDVVVD
jgi:murein DD-endopeptidase MepM/ murein hydrolase activator NlpD